MRHKIQLALIFFVLLLASPSVAQSQSVAISETEADSSSSDSSSSSEISETSDSTSTQATASDMSSEKSSEASRDKAEASSDTDEDLSTCDERKVRITRSAARKLTRSMGAARSVRPHGLSESVTIARGERTLSVHSEYEGKGAALTEAGKDLSLAAVLTTQGPIVTTLRWNSGCAVESTTIAVPSGPEIAFEPFRHWGNRIQWRLPNALDSDLSMKDAVSKALNSN